MLLVRKKGGKWNLPGGTVEKNEHPMAAALRELREETKLRLTALNTAGTLDIGDTRHLVFTTEVTPGTNAQANNEIEDCRWFDADQLKKKPVKDSAIALLNAFLRQWLEAPSTS